MGIDLPEGSGLWKFKFDNNEKTTAITNSNLFTSNKNKENTVRVYGPIVGKILQLFGVADSVHVTSNNSNRKVYYNVNDVFNNIETNLPRQINKKMPSSEKANYIMKTILSPPKKEIEGAERFTSPMPSQKERIMKRIGSLQELREVIAKDSSSSVTALEICCTPTELSKILEKLPLYPQIKELELTDHPIKEETVLKQLGTITQLEDLSLRGVGVTDNVLKSLSKLKNLKKLSLLECAELTDNGLKNLSKLEKLEELELTNCRGVTGKVPPLKSLKKLLLQMCTGVTDNGLKSLSELEKLEEFYVFSTEVTDDALQGLSKKLKVLILRDCEKVTGKIPPLKDLKKLTLLRCIGVTGNGLQSLSKLEKLEQLCLCGCTNAKGELPPLKRLMNLDLRECHVGIQNLLKDIPVMR